MDFVRLTGELFIYYVLIALGGAVLIGLGLGIFQAIGIDVEPIMERWILPSTIAGAALVATWLVEAKQSVMENIAPVLAKIFAPLFLLVLLAFITTMAWTGQWFHLDREILIAFDLLLVVVFGLLLYSVSARDPMAPPGLGDWVQLALVVTALVIDFLALWAIAARISDFGFTPNRAAALGLNVVLLVNLAPDPRQRLDPRDAGGAGVAGEAQAFRVPLHAHERVVDEPDRDLVRDPDSAGAPPRLVQWRARAGRCDRRLHA
jgi:hypothetical protein